MSLNNLTLEQLKEAISIKEEISTLERRLTAVLGGAKATTPSVEAAKAKTKGSFKRSAETVARMKASQQARWAKIRAAKSGTSSSAPANKSAAKSSAKGSKRKSGLTPEGRAKLAASMKARWAARKKAAASSASAK